MPLTLAVVLPKPRDWALQQLNMLHARDRPWVVSIGATEG